MKNKPLFDKTLNILVKAYQNDTLEHGDCNACAVGNMIAANCGYDYIKDEFGFLWWGVNYPLWQLVFSTGYEQRINSNAYVGDAKKQIDSTGYTWQELAKIEYAFETANKGNSSDDWILNGLLAVYDVLCEVHEVEKKEEDAKLIFVKH